MASVAFFDFVRIIYIPFPWQVWNNIFPSLTVKLQLALPFFLAQIRTYITASKYIFNKSFCKMFEYNLAVSLSFPHIIANNFIEFVLKYIVSITISTINKMMWSDSSTFLYVPLKNTLNVINKRIFRFWR